ncbi:MAG: DegT/DnrJ/EryC1/StrS family aminotransferase [Waddliaceae bacterium]
MRFIDIQQQYQSYKTEIDEAIARVLEKGNFILGEEVAELEEKLAAFVGVKHCLTVSSGTDSLLIALMALGIGPGDEVITTPFTFFATAEVIALIGAKPVFVDIEPNTYNIDIDQIESAITPRTKAIMPVSLFGQMPNYTRINAIAAKYNLPVIEDGAQSFGATQNGKRSCGVTTIGSTSFFPAKPFGCYGDGGALFTDDAELADKMRYIRTHGSQKRDYHPVIGINGRCDTLQAAIMLAKLPFFPQEIEARQKVASAYSERLKEYCTVPFVAQGNTSVYSPYTIRTPNRDQWMKTFSEKDIPVGVYYSKCVYEQPAFSYLGISKGSFAQADFACSEVLSLPLHPWISEEEIDRVVLAVKEAYLGNTVGVTK